MQGRHSKHRAARQARRRGPAARLCLAATTLGLLVLCSSAQALENPLTGPTGATGEKGATGERGPTGPGGSGGGGNGEASNFGQYTGAGSTGGLATGKQESGLWSATIHAPAGTEHEQTQGVASFPIPLTFRAKVKLNYRNEAEALMAIAPCVGSVKEPVILPTGNFCAYRGGKSAGSKETGTGVGNVDKNVTSKPSFQGSEGEKSKKPD